MIDDDFPLPEEDEESSEKSLFDKLFTAVGHRLVSELYEEFVEDILSRTKVVSVKRVGYHVITEYADGRKEILTGQRWPGDVPIGPTPYELIYLGENIHPLCPAPPMTQWMAAVVGMLPALMAPLSYALRRFK